MRIESLNIRKNVETDNILFNDSNLSNILLGFAKLLNFKAIQLLQNSTNFEKNRDFP